MRRRAILRCLLFAALAVPFVIEASWRCIAAVVMSNVLIVPVLMELRATLFVIGMRVGIVPTAIGASPVAIGWRISNLALHG